MTLDPAYNGNSAARPPSSQVVLAWIHNGDVRGDWAECYAELRLIDSHHRRLIDPTKRPIIEKGLYVPRNRNQVVWRFLKERSEPWLMFLDSDMLFAPAQFYALFDEAQTTPQQSVHAGLYYGIFASEGIGNGQNANRPPHGGIMISSTWLIKKDGVIHTVGERKLEIRDDLDACGMGFTLIHRDVLSALANAMPNHANAWFGHDEEADQDGVIDGIGEDTTFCTRAKKLGFKIYGHDTIALGHDKRTIITWEHHDYEQRRQFGDQKRP